LLPTLLHVLRFIGGSFVVMSLFSCSGTRPVNLGIKDGRLANCPSSPNCVSSDASDSAHSISAFQIIIPPTDAWRALRATLESLPRVQIITANQDYIHAECSSAFFGFVDDLELHLRQSQNSIAVRSAARLGHSDFGVNRKRLENLRGLLIERGLVRK
jgi:uncharacterized protein (DUF1499 family)